jgi:glycosyltransferase involved in cell wall biosynthesis
LVIANDNSTDNWKEELKEYLNDKRIIIKNVNLGKSYKVRNYLNSYIKNEISSVDYIGRLDADDYIVDNTTLSNIELIMDKYNPDVIISGNKLSVKDKMIDRINVADKRLLDFSFLQKKLEQMSNGNPNGELPSCNTFIKPTVLINYKEIESAEDHWFTVDLLLNRDKYKIYIANDILYSVYSLSGNLTSQNRKESKYMQSREKLLQYFLNKN